MQTRTPRTTFLGMYEVHEGYNGRTSKVAVLVDGDTKDYIVAHPSGFHHTDIVGLTARMVSPTHTATLITF